MQILTKAFKRKLERGTKVYLVTSDWHTGAHDKRCLSAICDFADDMKFDGHVINGDFLDLPELSRHRKGSVAKLENLRLDQSRFIGNKVLDQLQDALGKQCDDQRLVEGNHDANLWRWPENESNAPFKGDPSLSIRNFLNLDERGIEFFGPWPKAFTKLGSLYVTHGLWATDAHAKKHLDQFKACVLFGHVHSPQMYYGASINSQLAAYCTGHLADPNSENMSYAPTPNRWCQGFAVVYVRSNGEFNCQLIQFWNGTFFYGSRQYGK